METSSSTRTKCGDSGFCPAASSYKRQSLRSSGETRTLGKVSSRQLSERRSSSMSTDSSNTVGFSSVTMRHQTDSSRPRYVYRRRASPEPEVKQSETSTTSLTADSPWLDADFQADLYRVRQKMFKKAAEVKTSYVQKSPDASMTSGTEEMSQSQSQSVDSSQRHRANYLNLRKSPTDELLSDFKKHGSSAAATLAKVFTNQTVSPRLLGVLDSIDRGRIGSRGSQSKTTRYSKKVFDTNPFQSKSLSEVESKDTFNLDFNFPDGSCSILFRDDLGGSPLYRIVNHFMHKKTPEPQVDSEDATSKPDKTSSRDVLKFSPIGLSGSRSKRGLSAESGSGSRVDFRSHSGVTSQTSGLSELGNLRERSTSSQVGLSSSSSSSTGPGYRTWKHDKSLEVMDRANMLSISYDHSTIRDIIKRRNESSQDTLSSGMLSRRQSVDQALDEILWYRPKKTKSLEKQDDK